MVLKKEKIWIIGNIGSEKREYYKNSERENVITKTLKKQSINVNLKTLYIKESKSY